MNLHTLWRRLTSSEKNPSSNNHLANVQLMRDALKLYSNNALLLVQSSASLELLDGTETEKREHLRESIEIQEQILTYCDDSEVRGAVLFNIADSYYRYDDYNKALAYAEKLPNAYKSRENALVRILADPHQRNAMAEKVIERLMSSWICACRHWQKQRTILPAARRLSRFAIYFLMAKKTDDLEICYRKAAVSVMEAAGLLSCIEKSTCFRKCFFWRSGRDSNSRALFRRLLP